MTSNISLGFISCLNIFLGEKVDDKDEVQDEADEKERIRKKLIDDEEEDRKLLESIPDESMCYVMFILVVLLQRF